MLSLSTAFNAGRHRSWKKLLAEVRRLGFSAVELNVEVPERWMPDVEASVRNGEIRISSLHNYCPRLDGLPDDRTIYSGYHLTSSDGEERRMAVRLTRRTVSWAARLGAAAVVVHAGEVPTEPSGRELFRYIRQFGHGGRAFEEYTAALIADRRKKAGRCLDTLLRSLDDIVPFATENNVTIGLENRFYPHEVPDIGETRALLDRFRGGRIGYWHDNGHAEIFVQLGLASGQREFLDAFRDDIVGMHLHDLKKLSDHYAPGAGDFDFRLLAPYAARGIPLVIEAHDKSSAGEVKNSIGVLARAGLPCEEETSPAP